MRSDRPSRSASTFRRSRRRRRRTLLLCGGFVLLAAVIGIGCSASCVPTWYVPTSPDQTRLKADKRDLVNMLDRIGLALNGGRSIDLEIHEEQLNRWLTARAEFPFALPAALKFLKHPQVEFLDAQRLRVAGTAAWAGRPWVVSFVARVEATPAQLGLGWEALNVGALRVPRAWVAWAFDPPAGDSGSAWEVLTRGVAHWPNRGMWENGERPFRVASLVVSQGVLRISLIPTDKLP